MLAVVTHCDCSRVAGQVDLLFDGQGGLPGSTAEKYAVGA